MVKYSVLKENKQLFAPKYKLYLPSEQELIEEIEREKAMIVRERGEDYGVWRHDDASDGPDIRLLP